MDSGLFGGMMAAIIVPILFFVLSKTKTFGKEIPAGKSLEELHEKYKGWQGREAGLLVVFIVLCSFLSYAVLLGLSSLIFRPHPENVYTLIPPSFLWALFAFFWGMLLAAIPLELIFVRWMGREQYEEYQMYSSWKTVSHWGGNKSVDSKKVGKILTAFIMAVTIFFLPLTLDYYTYVTEKGMTLNRFFSFGAKTYAWNDVKDIKYVISFQAPNGDQVRSPHYEVTFQDGTAFSTHDTLFDWTEDLERQIFNYISQKSGKTMTIEDPFPNARPVE